MALGYAVFTGIERHPSAQLAECRRGGHEAPNRWLLVMLVAQDQADGVKLGFDVGQVRGSAVRVVQPLQQRNRGLDVLDERLTVQVGWRWRTG